MDSNNLKKRATIFIVIELILLLGGMGYWLRGELKLLNGPIYAFYYRNEKTHSLGCEEIEGSAVTASTLSSEEEAEFQEDYQEKKAEWEIKHKAEIRNIIVGYVVATLVAAGVIVFLNLICRKHLWVGIVVLVLCVLAAPFCLSAGWASANAKAPIIYLYPEEETVVNVQLELNGELGTTYPHYNEGGWTVTASPDGTLTGANGREYSYLFWEGSLMMDPDLSQGFCVKGEDTAEFLEWALEELGLNDIEADTFIMYWLPQMEGNNYNVISFQTTAYEDAAQLYVTPEPDTEIRVNMLWYSSLINVDIEEQDLSSINPDTREGFTVVEWGGEEYKAGLLQYLLK